MTRGSGKSTKTKIEWLSRVAAAKTRVDRLKKAERLLSKGLEAMVNASTLMHGNMPEGFNVGSGAWRTMPLFDTEYLRRFTWPLDALFPYRDDIRTELEAAREDLLEARKAKP